MGKPTEIYAPQQVGELALQEVRSCIEWAGRGVKLGLPTVDKVLKPLRPGNLCVIQAYTSNYKTGFMMAWARRMGEQIVQNGGEKDIVVYLSWEDTVEDVGLFDLAHDTGIDASDIQEGRLSPEAIEKLEVAAFRRGAMPVWFVGNSLANRATQSRLTMTQVETLLAWIEDQMGFRPVAIFLDYLNKIQPEGRQVWGDGRRLDIMELAYRASELAFKRGCPVITGAQSNRVSNDRTWKLPQAWDCMESSAIEQYAQVLLSLWMPGRTEAHERPLKGPDGKDTDVNVSDNLLVMGITKQKRGPAGGWWPLYVDAARNFIGPLDTRQDEPEPAGGWYGEPRQRGDGEGW